MNKTKQKGNIGELIAAAEFTKMGYYVFSELGDNAPFDLLIVHDNDLSKIYRIQVKCTETRNGIIAVNLYNNTRCYSRKYSENDFDYFAIYILDIDKIIYISLQEVYKRKKSFIIRCSPTKNNQKKYINYMENYLNFENKPSMSTLIYGK